MAANVGHGYRAASQTAWVQAQEWRTARRAMAQHFLEEGQAARQSFGRAWTVQIDETVDFAFEVAVDRINAAVKAKALVASAASGKVWTPPTTVYAGASVIDMAKGTITLGDGTTIDIRTAARIDVTA